METGTGRIVPLDEVEKKAFDVTVGGFTTAFIFPATSSILRYEQDLCGPMSQGVNDNQRVGAVINATRVTVRFSLWLQNASPYSGLSSGLRGTVEYRWFVYIDKNKQAAARTGNYPTGVSGSAASTFQAGGFLEKDRMQSFYNRDTIQQFRILHDSGLCQMEPKKRSEQYAFSSIGGEPYANFDDIQQYTTFMPTGSQLSTIMYSDNDLSADQVYGALTQNQILLGTAEGITIPVAGYAIDGSLDSNPLLANNVTFGKMRMLTLPQNPSVPVFATHTNNDSVRTRRR